MPVSMAYAYGNGLIRKDGEYPLFDGLGSERTVTNGSQTVTGTINMDAFGLTVNTTGSSTNPYKFAANSGYRDDGDAGLVHVGARYYDPQVGRFITRDTELDQHPYGYCEHDPVNQVDPSGHQPRSLSWYVNVVQAIIMNNWDWLATLIVTVGGNEIPPDVQLVLTQGRLPPMNTNPSAIAGTRGLINHLVKHINKIAAEPNSRARHVWVREIGSAWGNIQKKLKK